MYNISQKPIFPFNFRTDVKDPAIKPAFDKIYTLLDEMVSKFNTNAKDLENYIARFGPTQYLVATDRIEHLADTYEIIAKGATGVTMTSTPTISNSYGGARLLLIGTDDTRTVTLQDDSVLPGSNLYLGAPTVTLDAGAVCYLVYSEAIGKWCKTSVATSVLPGTVSSVGLSAPTGFTVTNSPITSFGTLALSFSAGYSLPLTTDTAKGVTAYGWGNHASAGYYVGTDTTIRALISSSATGLTYTALTGIFSLTTGYVIPTTTEESNWNTAYGWGNHAGLYTPIAHKTTEDALNGLVKVDGAGNYSAVTDNSSNWNTAYGWGQGLKLDQTTPQTVSNGAPIFSAGTKISGLFLATTTKTTTYTASATDDVIVCNSASNFTINLPVANGSGKVFYIKNINTNTVTVDGNTTDTIDGELTQSVVAPNCMCIQDYAANKWIII